MLLKQGFKFSLLLFFMVNMGMAATVNTVNVSQSQVTIDLSERVQYNIFSLENPSRIVIDLKETQCNVNVKALNLNGTAIQKIRYAPHDPKTLRIVFDMEKSIKYSSALQGSQIVVQFGEKKPPPPLPALPVKLATREFLVAIDAGHGGDDPGAISHRKHLREKDVVLSVAKTLQTMINAQPNMRAILIRNGDYFVGLRKRMELAREQGADLFISVHADSFNDPRASGASVFVLSEKGASNEAARWLAERENRADLVGGISLEDKGDILASVLIDLSQTASQTASYELAGHLLGQLGRITDLHHKTVQHAGFMVLKSPDIPSVLVELGFLSNPKGEDKLGSSSHQKALATALLAGVKSYAAKRPLPVKHPQDWTVATRQAYKGK